MKKILYIFFVAWSISLLHSCSEDDFPVPPASTVPQFSTVIDNDEFAPATVTFTNESIIPERAGTVTYAWSFGDGQSSSDKDPVHLYTKPGAFNVNLVIVAGTSLEVVNVTQTIVIKDANATGTPVFFTNGSIVYTALINDQAPIATTIGINTLGDSYGMAIDTVNDKLYIADFDGESILVADLDGKNLTEFRTNIGEPDALAIDYETSTIYWDTSSGVRRADMNDTDLGQYEDFVTGQANDPEGVSIDPVNRVLYWNNYNGGVWRKNLNGSGELNINPLGLGGGSMLVVDDHIFYDVEIDDVIYLKTANLDGSGEATVASDISRTVYGLAYDKYEDKIYWTDRNEARIMRANLDGSSAEPWFTGMSVRGVVIGKKKE